MAEFIKTGYKRLFEVRLLHHYFLDEGAEDFMMILSVSYNANLAAKTAKLSGRERRLAAYDGRKIFRITPTPDCAKQIGILKGVFRQTALGFLVAVPPETLVPQEVRFDFSVSVEDSDFFQYTCLPFFKNAPDGLARNQKIVEIRHEGKAYRYKPNVFVFRNNRPGNEVATREQEVPVALPKRYYLTKEIPTFDANTTYLAESFVKTPDNNLYRALRDKPSAPPSDHWQQLNVYVNPSDTKQPPLTVARFPAYVTQADIPDIVPLPGMTGVPAKGIQLTDELPDDMVALVQIHATALVPDFSLQDNGQWRPSHRVFDIHFKNRATYWRFFSKSTQQYKEPPFSMPRALTLYGNAMSPENLVSGGPLAFPPQKPYPPAFKIESSGSDLLKMYSNITQLTDIV